MKPPPPGPATNGTVTPIAAALATAASIALPPRESTSMPAWLAPRLMDATAPPVPTATGCFLTPAKIRPADAPAGNDRPRSAAARADVTGTAIRRRCIGTSRRSWASGWRAFSPSLLPNAGDFNPARHAGPGGDGSPPAACWRKIEATRTAGGTARDVGPGRTLRGGYHRPAARWRP